MLLVKTNLIIFNFFYRTYLKNKDHLICTLLFYLRIADKICIMDTIIINTLYNFHVLEKFI